MHASWELRNEYPYSTTPLFELVSNCLHLPPVVLIRFQPLSKHSLKVKCKVLFRAYLPLHRTKSHGIIICIHFYTPPHSSFLRSISGFNCRRRQCSPMLMLFCHSFLYAAFICPCFSGLIQISMEYWWSKILSVNGNDNSVMLAHTLGLIAH